MQPSPSSPSPPLTLHRARPLTVVVFVLGFLLASRHAIAEEPGALSNEAITNLYDQATAAVDAGDSARAHQIFLELWQHRQTYDIAMNLGYIEFKLGNFPRAAYYLRHALDHFPPTERLEVRRELETDLAQVTQRVATVHLTVSAPGATIAIDDVPGGKAPLGAPVFLAPGRHTLGAALDQRKAKRSLDVEAGREYQVALELSEPAPTAPSTRAPASRAPGPTTAPETEDSRSWTPIYLGGSIVVAALVTGGVLAASANDDADALRNFKQQGGPHDCVNVSPETAEECAERSDLATSIDWKRNVSTASFVTGVGAAVFTLGYLAYDGWFTPRRNESEQSIVLQPNFSTRRVGLELFTKF